VLNGSTAAVLASSTTTASTRSRTLGWLDISLWTGGRDKQTHATASHDAVAEDFEYLEQPATRLDDRGADDTSSEEGSCNGSIIVMVIFYKLLQCFECLQCFDAVGWAAGRASGL